MMLPSTRESPRCFFFYYRKVNKKMNEAGLNDRKMNLNFHSNAHPNAWIAISNRLIRISKLRHSWDMQIRSVDALWGERSCVGAWTDLVYVAKQSKCMEINKVLPYEPRTLNKSSFRAKWLIFEKNINFARILTALRCSFRTFSLCIDLF